MYNKKLNTGWQDMANINLDYPIAIIYKINSQNQPIIHLKDIRSLCSCIEYCDKENYDYDFTINLAEISDHERNKLETLIGVYIP